MYTRGLHVNDLAVLQGLTGLVVLFLFSAIPFLSESEPQEVYRDSLMYKQIRAWLSRLPFA